MKLADKELDGLIKQIAVFKEKHEETVSRSTQLQVTETKEIIQSYKLQIDHLTDKIVEIETPLSPWTKAFQYALKQEQEKAKNI